MADSKPRHYQTQLDKALTAGAWADPTPGAAPNGTALPWAELVRKWEKHVGGTAGSLALNLRTLSLYLTPLSSSSASQPPLPSSSTPSSSSTTAPPASTSSHLHRPHLHARHPIPASFVPANDITPRDLDGDDRSGRPTSSSHLDAWASCRAPEEWISDVEEGLKETRELVNKGKTKADKDSALLIEAFHLLALGRYHESLNVLAQVDWDVSAGSPESSFVERVRGKVVEGISHELSSPPNSAAALAAYTSAVYLLESLPTISLPFSFSSASKAATSNTSFAFTAAILKEFTSHRELWRWGEHALFRGSLLAALTTPKEALRWLRTYHFYETVFPPSFRPERRAAILLLYVRALALERPALPSSPSTVTHPVGSTSSAGLISKSRGSSSSSCWAKEAEGVAKRGMVILEAGGARGFPKAGEKRVEVEEFVVGCVALWERGGEKRAEATSLLKLLWWATTQTFNSQPILRHLTRLLLATSAPTDARRTFELYVKIVEKARETSDSPASAGANANGQGEGVPLEEPKEAEALGSDDDRTFVETLVFGGRLIGKECGEPREGLKYLKKAEELSEHSADVKDNQELRSRVEGVKGMLQMALVVKDHDPLARTALQTNALAHLTNATTLFPSSAKAFYNLAYVQAECRQIDESILSIRSALELDPSNVHGWHLLTLLLTAKGKWHDAAQVADIGLASWDGDEEVESAAAEGPEMVRGDAIVVEKDFGLETTTDITFPQTIPSLPPLISRHGHLILMSSILSSNPSLLSTKSERLEAVLQLRMTQTVIAERLDGPAAAMERQQELFAFFSARCGKVAPSPPSSVVPTTLTGYPRSNTLETNGSTVARSTAPAPRRVDFGSVEKRSYDGPRSQHGEGGEKVLLSSNGNGEASQKDQSLQKGIENLAVSIPPPPPQVTIEPPNGSSTPPVLTHDTPPGSSSSSSDNMSVAQSERLHRDQHRNKRFLPKHLLSPGGRSHGLGRSASLSRLQIARQSASSLALNSLKLDSPSRRSISNASSIHSRSRRQSLERSELGGPATSYDDYLPQAPAPPSQEQEPSGRTARETRLLSQLWLMSAATFRRWGKLEQALGAIQEAEVLDAKNPEVWVQLGLYHDLLSSPTLAISCFTKALVFDPLSIPAQVHLARLYLLTPPKTNLALAHGILNSLTQGKGWDCSEAWYFLARVCEEQDAGEGRSERVRECLNFGKALEGGRCVRGIGEGVVERWI